jgi:hypothetical protein
MQWVSDNWVWILIAIAFVAMHLFGHGGHGGHGEDAQRADRAPPVRRDDDRAGGHHH